jgi:hypothetical protein
MKRSSLIRTAAVIALASCSAPQPMHPAGRFFNAFALDETIKGLNLPELEFAGGTNSFTSSAGEPTPHRKSAAMEFRIKDRPGSQFDAKSFLQKLKKAIELEAQNSEVHVSGGGSIGGESFHINYQDGENQGAVDVIGVRLANDRYKIWWIVRELSVPKAD